MRCGRDSARPCSYAACGHRQRSSQGAGGTFNQPREGAEGKWARGRGWTHVASRGLVKCGRDRSTCPRLIYINVERSLLECYRF